MRAAVAQAGVISVEEVPDPHPGSGQVLVAPLTCGICGSDLHYLKRQAERAARTHERGPAVVLGHEFCAEVMSGPAGGACESFPPGTLVTSVPYATGPDTTELLGFSSQLPGGFAELMVLDSALIEPVPEGMAPDTAALAEPLAVGTHAVERGQPDSGSVACVLGCGPVGLAVVLALRAGRYGPIVVIDPSSTRRNMAGLLGADHVDAGGKGLDAALAHLGLGHEAPPSPLLARSHRPSAPVTVFDCVGKPGVFSSTVSALPRYSKIVMVGVCMDPDTFDPRVAIDRELTVEFVFAYTRDDFRTALHRLAGDDAALAGTLVTARTTLDGLDEACRSLSAASDQVKVVAFPQRTWRDDVQHNQATSSPAEKG